MIERQPGSHRHFAPRIAAEILHVLMDAPDKADVRRTAKNALHLCRRTEQFSRIHIDIDEMHDESVEFLSSTVLLDQRTHAHRTLLREILIRIGKDNPVPHRLIEREILCRRKIVDPVERDNLCPACACNLGGRIR